MKRKPAKRQVLKRFRQFKRVTPEIIKAGTWYALKVAPQKEGRVMDDLHDRDVTAYVPVRVEYRWRNKFDKGKREKKQPFRFPAMRGYVFVNSDAPDFWAKLSQIENTLGVVGCFGKPLTIPHAQLVHIAKCWPNGLQQPENTAYMQTGGEFAAGDEVVALAGPFADTKVTVVEVSGLKSTIRALMFGQMMDIEVRTMDFVKAG